MNCKTCLKQIPKFINDESELACLSEFIDHIEFCPECKEELTIELLVQEGLNSLESGEAFDINAELHHRIEYAHSSIRFLDNLSWLYYGIVSINAVALAIMFILLAFIPR